MERETVDESESVSERKVDDKRTNPIQILTLIIAVVAVILAVFSVMVPEDVEEEPENEAPTAVITVAETSVEEGTDVLFDASGSTDSDGTIVEYTWDFGDGGKDSGMYSNHAYSTANSYTVTLTVVDEDGDSGTASIMITVTEHVEPANDPPMASIVISNTTVEVDDFITLDGSGSTDSDGAIVRYLWDYGDGVNASGMNSNHYYTSSGLFMITLTVTDNDGATNSSYVEVTVNEPPEPQNDPPTASFTANPSTAPVYTYINFNASASSDPDGTIVEFTWDFGDGSMDSGKYVSHYYTLNGTFTVKLTVVDDGGASATTSTQVTATPGGGPFPNQPPTADIGVNRTTLMEGESVHFNASGSHDPDGAIVEYTWDFDDGAVGTGILIDHIFENPGTYDVVLTVHDNDGAPDTDLITITVSSPVSTPTGAIFFSEVSTGNYTGGFISISEQVLFSDVILNISDSSLGQYANQDPISPGVVLQVPGGVNITYTDVNTNGRLDTTDVITVSGAGNDDEIKFIYIPTGGKIAGFSF